MSLRATRLASFASVVAAAALFVGCTQTLQLDNTRLEQVLVSGLNDNGITATVSCPTDIPLAQGTVSQCTATTPDGTNLTIQVTQTDGSGNVNWQIVGS